MRIPERQIQKFTVQSRLKTDTLDFQIFRKGRLYPFHHVGDDCTHRTVHRRRKTIGTFQLHQNTTLLLTNGYAGRKRLFQLPLRSFHRHGRTVHGNRHFFAAINR